MGFDIQLPQINAQTDSGKLEQIRSYLYQFTEQLKWALNTFESAENSGGIVVTNSTGTGVAEVKRVSTFNELKALIISSADFVESMATEIKQIYDGSGTYVAKSDFGIYKEERSALLETDTETGVTLVMTKEATIDEDSDGDGDYTRIYEGCIKIGDVTMPDDGETKYGISVGQLTVKENKTDDEVTYNKTFKSSARFTSTGIQFFDKDEDEVAYIETIGETSRFYIHHAEILSSLKIGGYLIDAEEDGGIAFSWVGGEE